MTRGCGPTARKPWSIASCPVLWVCVWLVRPPATGGEILVVHARSEVDLLCAHQIYAAFGFAAAGTVSSLGGITERRIAEPTAPGIGQRYLYRRRCTSGWPNPIWPRSREYTFKQAWVRWVKQISPSYLPFWRWG